MRLMAARKKDQPLRVAPQAPDYLGEIGRDHWASLFSSLVAMKLATELDKPVIEMACSQYEKFRTAGTDREQQAAISSYLKIMSKYGATPKDRRIMKLAQQRHPESGDPRLEEELGL
jgi:hypothetical protein